MSPFSKLSILAIAVSTAAATEFKVRFTRSWLPDDVAIWYWKYVPSRKEGRNWRHSKTVWYYDTMQYIYTISLLMFLSNKFTQTPLGSGRTQSKRRLHIPPPHRIHQHRWPPRQLQLGKRRRKILLDPFLKSTHSTLLRILLGTWISQRSRGPHQDRTRRPGWWN